MKSTKPSFFRDGTAGIKPEWVGPWSAHAPRLSELRKAIDAERDPLKRSGLEIEYNATLIKQSRANPSGIVPLTFAERELLEERQRRLPELWATWLATMDEILYWTGADKGVLLEQSAEEFKAAVLALVMPPAK